MKNIICRILCAFLAITLFFTTSENVEKVYAEGLDIHRAINEIIGNRVGGNYHYSYDGGKYFDALLTSDNAEEIYNIGLDCTSGTLVIVSKAIRNAGGDPYRYFGECRNYLNNVYPYELSQHFTNMEKVADSIHDSSSLVEGDILVYGGPGQKGHMNVYCGNNQTFDFGSNGNGSSGNYRGFSKFVTFKDAASSTTGSYPLTAVYRLKMNRTVHYSIVKKSSDSSVSNTRQYSLASATFGVYTSSDCREDSRIDTLTTDSNGYAQGESSVDYGVDTLYIKELSAPVNFALTDMSIHTVLLQDGNGQTEFFDAPLYADHLIEIAKVDKEGKKNAADMSEAHFLINYYDSFGDISESEPYASWTIKTKAEYSEDGVAYVAKMDDDHLVSGDFIRNRDGNPVLPMGTIVIKETKAAENYTIEGGYLESGVIVSSSDSLSIQIGNDNGTIRMYAGNQISEGEYEKEEVVIRGSYEVFKKDRDVLQDETQQSIGGFRSQGDASFANAEFDLYYLGNGTDGNVSMMIDHDGDGLGDGQEYLPSSEKAIDHIVLNASGYYQAPNDTYLSFGNYRLIETKAPRGYSLIDGNTGKPIMIDFSITENREKICVNAIETVYQTNIQIMKTQNESSSSSFTKPEVGAVFKVVLKKYVEEEAKGKEITREIVLSAYEKASEWSGTDGSNHDVSGYTKMEYGEIITGDNGIGTSGMLAYGTYYLVQESSASEMGVIHDVKEFSITDENQPTLTFTATNQIRTYTLKLFKKDADTGKRVSLSSSAFKIHMLFDKDGKDVSTTTTNDSLSNRLVNGYVTQVIGDSEEKTVYDTFMTASFTQSHSSDKLEEGMFYGVDNSKESEQYACTVLPLQLMPGIYQLEEVVTSNGYSTSEPIQFVIREDAITKVNETHQNVIEVEAFNKRLTGNVKFQKQISNFDQADVSLIEKDFTQFGFTLFAEEDIYSPDDGSIITKKDEPAKRLTHMVQSPYETIPEIHPDENGFFEIQQLPLGKYYLKETTVPDGFIKEDKVLHIVISQSMFDHAISERTEYPFGLGEVIDRSVKSEDVICEVDGNEKEIHTIQNDVTKISISKKEISGSDELPGATLHLFGENVDLKWISSEKPYQIEGLPAGKYTLEETGAPDGYFYHEAIQFEMKNTGIVQTITMEDIPVVYEILKVDEDGNPVEGVKLSLFDTTDQKTIPLENDGVTKKTPFILEKQLIPEHVYELREEAGVNGYYQAEKITFTVPRYAEQKTIQIVMKDIRTGIYVDKQDQYANPVIGAKMQILEGVKNEDGSVEAKEGQVLYEFETKGDLEDISSYVEGSNEIHEQCYVLREIEAPEGFEVMQDLPFCVTGTKNETQILRAIDIRKNVEIKIVKTDSRNMSKVLSGAQFALYDENKNILTDIYGKECIAESNEEGVIVFTIPFVKKCYTKELHAPEGYLLNDAWIEIQVSKENVENPIILTVDNQPKQIVDTSDSFHMIQNLWVVAVSTLAGYCLIRQRLH